MRRIAAVFCVLILLAGCGPSENGSLGPGPTGAAPTATNSPTGSPADPTAEPSDEPSTSTITVQVWFARNGKVFHTKRTRPSTVATSRLALTELVAGPSTLERSVGVTNGVAAGTTFDIIGISNGVATVDFPDSFYAGGRDPARLRQAQVVHTLTQFPTVTKVGFLKAGQATSAPVGRADYADLLPRIVVLSPIIGSTISSPVTVSGTADVHEATVSMRVLDAAGAELVTKFTTATCGSGCRGDYSTSLAFACVKKLQTGPKTATIEVYEVSMEDGSRINSVSIPVTVAGC